MTKFPLKWGKNKYGCEVVRDSAGKMIVENIGCCDYGEREIIDAVVAIANALAEKIEKNKDRA